VKRSAGDAAHKAAVAADAHQYLEQQLHAPRLTPGLVWILKKLKLEEAYAAKLEAAGLVDLKAVAGAAVPVLQGLGVKTGHALKLRKLAAQAAEVHFQPSHPGYDRTPCSIVLSHRLFAPVRGGESRGAGGGGAAGAGGGISTLDNWGILDAGAGAGASA
jgi:hypothetical protein